MDSPATKSLEDILSAALPKGKQFTIYHISTPPTRCDAIYSPPPHTKPDRTFCESHLLQVAIPCPESGRPVFFIAIECLLYTTRHLTTLFVSKADSTGLHSLLHLDRLHESPLRTITTAFISHLVATRLRPGIKFAIDLFARAANQYIYPASSENPAKHVSDDRQLVRWWCRVLHPILAQYDATPSKSGFLQAAPDTTTSQGYLLVPGEDTITPFLSLSARSRWSHSHPLRSLSQHPAAPPRCLVPRFPDDPKCRFLDELDEELPDASNQTVESPSKRGTGKWKSVANLEQFWEMMAFRSECSSGRLVGFIWIVITPPASEAFDVGESQEIVHHADCHPSQASASSNDSISSSQKSPRKKLARELSGPIPEILPKILRPPTFDKFPIQRPWFWWPQAGRGKLVLPQNHYQKATDMLLRLDFADAAISAQSTAAWLNELAILGAVDAQWGTAIVGQKDARVEADASDAAVNTLGVKRKTDPQVNLLQAKKLKLHDSDSTPTVNVLSAGLLKKKPNLDPPELTPTINVLGAGLIKKKPKKIAPTTMTQ